MTRNEINITDVIENQWEPNKSDYNKDGRFSKTTQFILPSIELIITPKFLSFFINSYLQDVEYDHIFKRPLFVLFKSTMSKEWLELYKELKANKNYKTDYNVGFKDGWDLIMVVYEVPEQFSSDYLNFRKGKYSQFSVEYKKKFPRFVNSNNKKEESQIWKIIHKSPELRKFLTDELGLFGNTLDEEDELWESPRKKEEYYNYRDT